MLQNVISKYLEEGKKSEDEFANMFLDAKVKKSNKRQDTQEHWDISLSYELKIDVKGVKKDWRGGEKNENIHWVELMAVSSNGSARKGWLYGEATHFAFETFEYWVLVEKSKLQEFVKIKCAKKEVTHDPKDALYKLYTRKGRNDKMTKVKTIDLCSISERMIKKP